MGLKPAIFNLYYYARHQPRIAKFDKVITVRGLAIRLKRKTDQNNTDRFSRVTAYIDRSDRSELRMLKVQVCRAWIVRLRYFVFDQAYGLLPVKHKFLRQLGLRSVVSSL